MLVLLYNILNKISYGCPKLFPIITVKVGYRAFRIIKKRFLLHVFKVVNFITEYFILFS